MRKKTNPPKAVTALREEIAHLEAERDRITEDIQARQRALSMLLSPTGESFSQLIDMAKVYLLRNGEQSYEKIRDHIRIHGGVVVRGNLDHRLRQSLSRAVAGKTVTVRQRGEDHFYTLSRKESERLKTIYSK